jgi:hypothetical protein
MPKAKQYVKRSTFQHWLALSFVLFALLLLGQAHASSSLKLMLAAVAGLYVVWNVWHHNSQGRARVETFLEYGLIALITWFIVSSVM